jgi:hypothetical protein
MKTEMERRFPNRRVGKAGPDRAALEIGAPLRVQGVKARNFSGRSLPVQRRGKHVLGLIWMGVIALVPCLLHAAEIPKANEQKTDGTIALLATNATVHGKTIRYEPQPHKNTIGYWTKAEDWVSWDFEVTTPGKFDVTLTQACGKGSGGSEVNFSIGEQIIKDIVPDTGAFTNWTNRVIGTFTLAQPGEYSIEVKPVKKPGLAVMDLRAIVLKPLK